MLLLIQPLLYRLHFVQSIRNSRNLLPIVVLSAADTFRTLPGLICFSWTEPLPLVHTSVAYGETEARDLLVSTSLRSPSHTPRLSYKMFSQYILLPFLSITSFDTSVSIQSDTSNHMWHFCFYYLGHASILAEPWFISKPIYPIHPTS